MLGLRFYWWVFNRSPKPCWLHWLHSALSPAVALRTPPAMPPFDHRRAHILPVVASKSYWLQLEPRQALCTRQTESIHFFFPFRIGSNEPAREFRCDRKEFVHSCACSGSAEVTTGGKMPPGDATISSVMWSACRWSEKKNYLKKKKKEEEWRRCVGVLILILLSVCQFFVALAPKCHRLQKWRKEK